MDEDLILSDIDSFLDRMSHICPETPQRTEATGMRPITVSRPVQTSTPERYDTINGILEPPVTLIGEDTPGSSQQGRCYGRSNIRGRSQETKEALYSLPMPQGLVYDGTGEINNFMDRFLRYAKRQPWYNSDSAITDNLCFCLRGKASDYFSMLVRTNRNISSVEIVDKLYHRFGHVNYPDRAQMEFHNATQWRGESLDDWYDRLQCLSVDAFVGMRRDQVEENIKLKIISGLRDRVAARHVANKRLRTLSEVVDALRWYNHVEEIIPDHTEPKGVVRYRDEFPEVMTTGLHGAAGSTNLTPIDKSELETLRNDYKNDNNNLRLELKGMIDGVKSENATQMSRLQDEIVAIKELIKSRPRTPRGQVTCYVCGRLGHISISCPSRKDNFGFQGYQQGN